MMKWNKRRKKGRKLNLVVQQHPWSLGIAACILLHVLRCPTFAGWVPIGRMGIGPRPAVWYPRPRYVWRIIWGSTMGKPRAR